MPVYEIKSFFKDRNHETIIIAETPTDATNVFNKDYSFRKIKEISECRGSRIIYDKKLPTPEENDKVEELLKKTGF
jgi:hypothetical protein